MSSGGASNSNNSSAAFSRLNRPGSGRLLTAGAPDGATSSSWGQRSSSTSRRSSNSSTPASLSPTSPMGPVGLVPEHRIRPLPGGLVLPAPGGGLIPGTIASPEQQEKRLGLKISFSTPNIRRAAGMKNSTSASCNLSALQNFPGLSQIGVGTSVAPSSSEEKSKLLLYKGSHSTGKLKFKGEDEFDFKAEDLTDLGEIGRGAFGSVNKMTFGRGDFNKVMAVKRIRSTVDEREQKELLMDLDVVMRSNDCPYIVLFFGAIFKEGDCWICMEIMDTSTDKFYKFIYDRLNESIPEKVIGKITVATVKALNYLKEKLKIIHRDVKPSNILLGKASGSIKLCDFGISGQLVDSIAKTRDAGCRPYMAPERIDPQRAKGYDVRSDVWSLGITLIELATGQFPYPKWNSVFEQLQQVVHGDPPRLERGEFTVEFVNFVNTCLIKDELQRPKYTKLLEHPFIKRSDSERVDVADYVSHVLERWEENGGEDEEPMDLASISGS